jgi:hypothetical protein
MGALSSGGVLAIVGIICLILFMLWDSWTTDRMVEESKRFNEYLLERSRRRRCPECRENRFALGVGILMSDPIEFHCINCGHRWLDYEIVSEVKSGYP